MALKLSKNVGLTDIVTDANPITTEHPLTGSAVELRQFLFNDNAAYTYQTISIDPTDTTGSDESTIVQLAPDNAGSPGTYLAGGVALTMANISDSNVAKPFWVKVTMPSSPNPINKTDIKLDIKCREYAV